MVTARDLLPRTVLYKDVHHGSYNATLNGVTNSEYPNLGWMAHGEHGREFTVMITAVRKWAETRKGWDHPLAATKHVLMQKAPGRVCQTDTDFDQMQMPEQSTIAVWDRFRAQVRGGRLYFDCTITP